MAGRPGVDIMRMGGMEGGVDGERECRERGRDMEKEAIFGHII